MARATPRKGKAKVKITKSGKKVSYGQAGKAKGGGSRVKPGTSKGDSYCARSLGIKKRLSKKKQKIKLVLPSDITSISVSEGNSIIDESGDENSRYVSLEEGKIITLNIDLR